MGSCFSCSQKNLYEDKIMIMPNSYDSSNMKNGGVCVVENTYAYSTSSTNNNYSKEEKDSILDKNTIEYSYTNSIDSWGENEKNSFNNMTDNFITYVENM